MDNVFAVVAAPHPPCVAQPVLDGERSVNDRLRLETQPGPDVWRQICYGALWTAGSWGNEGAR